MLGELSSARQVLESGDLAPGNLSTLRALTDPEKRPSVPSEPVPRELFVDRTLPVGLGQVGSEHPESLSRRGTRAIRDGERHTCSCWSLKTTWVRSFSLPGSWPEETSLPLLWK